MATDGNAALIERDLAHLVHPLQHNAAHEGGRVWVSGEGAWLTDADGRRFIDGLSGLWNVSAGHGRRELVDAASAQMMRLPYASGYSGSTNERAIELGERLAGITAEGINRFFFTSGGGEASDSNFKMARSYWKMKGRPEKTKVIARQWGYHGVTLAAMSATGMAPYWGLFEPRVPGFVHIPSPYPYFYDAPAGVSPGVAAANELEQAILREGPETVAMFIAEPVQGAGGVIVPPDDYFPRIREICDAYDVLLVADEVITGFGRTGRMFGMEHWGVKPDLIQFAKAVTSGYFPLGGIGISDEIAATLAQADTPWMHAYTYSAHPVGCAVALAMLDIVEGEDFPAQAARKGERLIGGLREAIGDHPNVGEVRGLGLMAAVELVRDRDSRQTFDPADKVGPRVLGEVMDRGLFTRVRGDVLCLAPPIVTRDEDIDRIVEIVHESVTAVLGRG
ncbi:aspartate aminotransferase family protein [Arhodomonas aquaeolei]|uniref:aminotransferase family protein n=1 Tax=Arhodomonas aquaeolei TaxID=2369 RepID=UPI002168158A|nr:aspartate aminotransferase family protein [Arhodomonas aquaeolei]MCS4505776.1 aspartate aminotransferase family protein [Arhodomonas aquaeolei]